MGLKDGNNEFSFVKITNDDSDPTRMFGLQDKVDGVWVAVKKKVSFDGYLLDIETGSYEYKGDVQKTFVLVMQSDGVKYKISINYNNLSRGILNTLAGVKDFGTSLIDMTLGKSKDGEHDNCWVYINGDKSEWAYDYKELPSSKDDQVAFDNSITKMIEDVVRALHSSSPVNEMVKINQAPTPEPHVSFNEEGDTVTLTASTTPIDPEPEVDDDLPF